MDSHTAHVRVSWAAERFIQMHASINIFYTVVVQNIENWKSHRQVDSVDAGLNRESKSHIFFLSAVTLLHIWKFPKKNYSCWEWLNFYYCYQAYNNLRRCCQWPAMTDDQLTANNHRWLFGVYSWSATGDIYAHTTPNWVKLADLWAWHSTGGRITYLTPHHCLCRPWMPINNWLHAYNF